MLFRFADRRGEKCVSKLEFQNTLNTLGLSNILYYCRAKQRRDHAVGIPDRLRFIRFNFKNGIRCLSGCLRNQKRVYPRRVFFD